MLWLDSGSHDPFYNLALEEHLFQTVREDEVFFLWRNTPCVVVGAFRASAGRSGRRSCITWGSQFCAA